jgi:HEAT repeat protein
VAALCDANGLITPSQFAEHSAYDLLQEAARGRIGFDHRLLHALVDNPQKTLPDLIRFSLEDPEDKPIHLYDDLLDVFRYLRSPEAMPFFIEYIRRDPTTLPDSIVEALYPIRHQALEPLIELYQTLEEDQSGEVAFLLASFRVHDPRVLRILLDRLEYDAGDGALCLGLYGDAEAKPALEQLLTTLDTDDAHLRQDILDAIQQLGRQVDEEVFEHYDIWEDYPAKLGPNMDALTESERVSLLDAPDAEYRASAAGSWINRDLDAATQQKLLDRATKDEDVSVRAKAWQALGSAIDDTQIREKLLSKLMDDASPAEERCGALLGLARDAGNEPIRTFAIRFYDDPETRVQAMEAMRNSFDRTFAEYFPKHLEDADPEVKREAIYGVGYLGITDRADQLKQFFDDDEYRSDALFAFALSTRAEISRGRIRALFRKIEDLAGGLAEEEVEIVQLALDERLMLHGHNPVFFGEAEETAAEPAQPAPSGKVGRNDPCPCGSGKKFKKCCGA